MSLKDKIEEYDVETYPDGTLVKSIYYADDVEEAIKKLKKRINENMSDNDWWYEARMDEIFGEFKDD